MKKCENHHWAMVPAARYKEHSSRGSENIAARYPYGAIICARCLKTRAARAGEIEAVRDGDVEGLRDVLEIWRFQDAANPRVSIGEADPPSYRGRKKRGKRRGIA